MGDFVYHPLHMVWVLNIFPTPARHLLKSGASVIEPSVVVPKDVALFIGHPSQLGNIIRKSAEALLTLAQGFLRQTAPGAVPDAAPTCGDGNQQAQDCSEDQDMPRLVQTPACIRGAYD